MGYPTGWTEYRVGALTDDEDFLELGRFVDENKLCSEH